MEICLISNEVIQRSESMSFVNANHAPTNKPHRFISGVVFCIFPEVLMTMASDGPDSQDTGFPVYHKGLAVPQ